MIGCSLSRKRLNHPASSPSSSRPVCGRRWVRSLAAGDVAQHVGDAEDRPGHAAGGQPQHQQAEHRGAEAEAQFDPGAFATHVVQLPLQRQGRAEQGALRHFEEHAPGLGAGNRLQRLQHLEVVVLVEQLALAGGQQLQEFAGVLRIRLGRFLPSRPASRLLPANSPAGLRMPTWPTPS